MSRIVELKQENINYIARRKSAIRAAIVSRLRGSVAGVAAALALPAAAQATAVYSGTPDHLDVFVPVTASVAGRCSFSSAPSGTYEAGDITQGFAHDFPFSIKCNTPFRVGVESQNGGLSATAAAPPGYTALAPYDVSLTLVGHGGTTPASATCDAGALAPAAASPCSFRGPAAADQGLRFDNHSNGTAGSRLRVSAPAYRGEASLLASSNYHDVLTVTVSVSP